MKMGKAARRTRKGIAGIVATVIMFAILFTVGTSYFIFVNSNNSQYVQNLVSASNRLQGAGAEDLMVTTALASNGDVAFYVNNTSGLSINMTVAYVLAATGGLLRCDGVGLPGSAGCGNTSPSLWAVVNAGKGSPSSGTYDTGYVYTTGTTDTVKIITQRGNTYSATYPNNDVNQAQQAASSQALTINLATYRWVQLIPQATSVVQTKFAANCNSANCGAAYTSSVTAGNTLVYGLGWWGQSPPSTPTDTLGDSYALAVSNSVSGTFGSPSMVQNKYNINCNSSNCQQAFTSSVTSGNLLVYALGWSTNSPPSTPTDTLGDSYTLGVSNSVSSTVNSNPSFVQDKFVQNCGSASCGAAFGSNIASGDLLVYGVDWFNQAVPSTPTDTRGDSFTLGASNSVAVTTAPSQVQAVHNHDCNSASCAQAFGSSVTAGDVLVVSLGWYDVNPPSAPTDTLGDTYVLGASQSVASGGHTYYEYIWYALATSSGADTITASFGSSVHGEIWSYELSGVAVTGITSSTGSSSGGSTSLSVNSFTPNANSYVISAAETSSAASIFTQGSGYTLDGTCSGHNGCDEHDRGVGSATTAPMTIGSSATWVEAAIAFTPTTYNSYIWYATAASSGADTITATFATAVTAPVSIYELNGYTATGLQTSTGSSAAGSNQATVSSFTPASNSIVIGNVETAASNNNIGQGGGYTVILGGGSGCGADYGCSEYQTGLGSSTTVQFSLNPSSTWVEAAISFPPTPVTYYSYIWYATARSSGADTITATFSSTVAGTISIYELNEYTVTGLQTSTGSSSSGSSQASVTSFTPASNSFVIGNGEDSASNANWGQQGGFTIIQGGGGACGHAYGCSEYQSGLGSATTVAINIGGVGNVPWVESAISFAPGSTNYYSYIWMATALSSGADTVNAAFAGTVTGSVSLYEISGFSATGYLTAIGSSSSGSTTASVASMSAATGSLTIGNAETLNAGTSFTQGNSYTLIPGGSCNSSWGCSQYSTSVTGSTNVPFSLNPSAPWVETAINFGAAINAQSGYQVGGYPSMGIADSTDVVWQVSFTNTDAGHRSVTLWPQSVMGVNSVKNANVKVNYFYIVDGINSVVTQLTAYTSTTGNFLTIPYGSTLTLYFGATAPLGSSPNVVDYDNNSPFASFFSLTGQFGDGTLYGETIPYPMGIVTGANAHTTPTAGATGNVITVSCSGNCGFNNNAKGAVGWIDSTGKETTLTTFTTTNNGGLPSLSFTVPSAPAGYYTVMVTDYVNTVFMTFQHT